MEKNVRNPLISYGIHITHNDADAVGCAVALTMLDRMINYSNDTYFCTVGTQDDVLNKALDELIESKEIEYIKSIVISDLSLKVETCKRLMDIAFEYDIRLLGVDHHETNDLGEKYSWWHVANTYPELKGDRQVSAAYLLFLLLLKCFGTDSYLKTMSFYNLLKVIEMISDYDTWEWRRHPEHPDDEIKEDIVSIICKEYGPREMYKMIIVHFTKKDYNGKLFPDAFYDIYKLNITKRDRYLSTLDTVARVLVTEGNINCAMLISENDFNNAGAGYLYNSLYIDMVAVIYPSTCRIGLRTDRDDINVAEIAKKYGGGGHQKAAGFKLSEKDFLKVMEKFYLEAEPYNEYLENALK